eukprot:TRINITY_DN17457_c0_g1_i1.p1 TRINITY_DN17457_c0_g1~~TRINITY_DN17457_c0_g1_i1.p1  ORF type:complete len:2202 (+),score=500.84 TRINITY_DN17457_c0_g1_i1:49-6654(+)
MSDDGESDDDVAPFASTFWGKSAGDEEDIDKDLGLELTLLDTLKLTRRDSSSLGLLAREVQGTKRFSLENKDDDSEEEAPESPQVRHKFRAAVKKAVALRVLSSEVKNKNNRDVQYLLRHLVANIDDESVVSAGVSHLRDFIYSNRDDAQYAGSLGGIKVALHCIENMTSNQAVFDVAGKILSRLTQPDITFNVRELIDNMRSILMNLRGVANDDPKRDQILEPIASVIHKLSLSNDNLIEICKSRDDDEGKSISILLFEAAELNNTPGSNIGVMLYAMSAAANICLGCDDDTEQVMGSDILPLLLVKSLNTISSAPDDAPTSPEQDTPLNVFGRSSVDDANDPFNQMSPLLLSPMTATTPFDADDLQKRFLSLANKSSMQSSPVLTSTTNIGGRKLVQLIESSVFCAQVLIENENAARILSSPDGIRSLGVAADRLTKMGELVHLRNLLEVIITMTNCGAIRRSSVKRSSDARRLSRRESASLQPATAVELVPSLNVISSRLIKNSQKEQPGDADDPNANPPITFANAPDIVKRVLVIYGNICTASLSSPRNKSVTQGHPIYQHKCWKPILYIMEKHQLLPTNQPPGSEQHCIIQLCCSILGRMASCSQGAVKLSESGCGGALLNAVRVLHQGTDEQDMAIWALKRLTLHSEDRYSSLINPSEKISKSIRTILSILHKQAKNLTAVQFVNNALLEISATEYGKKQITKNSGIKVLLAAAQSNSKQFSERGKLLSILVNVIHGSQDSQTQLVSNDGLSFIMSVMNCCTTQHLPQLTDCCKIIAQVSRYEDSHRVKLERSNAVPLLLHTILPMYEKDASIQWAILAIGNLCQNVDIAATVMRYDGLDCVVDLVSRFGGREADQKEVKSVVGWVIARLVMSDKSCVPQVEEDQIAISCLEVSTQNRSRLDRSQRLTCTEVLELATLRRKREEEEKKKLEETRLLEIKEKEHQLERANEELKRERAAHESRRSVFLVDMKNLEDQIEGEKQARLFAESRMKRMKSMTATSQKLPMWISEIHLSRVMNARLQQIISTDGDTELLNLTGAELESFNAPEPELRSLKAAVDLERSRRGFSPIHCTNPSHSKLPFWIQLSNLSDSLKAVLNNNAPSFEGAEFNFSDKDDFWTSVTNDNEEVFSGIEPVDKKAILAVISEKNEEETRNRRQSAPLVALVQEKRFRRMQSMRLPAVPPWIADIQLQDIYQERLRTLANNNNIEILEATHNELQKSLDFPPVPLSILKTHIDNERVRRGYLPQHCTNPLLSKLPFWLQLNVHVKENVKLELNEKINKLNWFSVTKSDLSSCNLSETEKDIVIREIGNEQERQNKLSSSKKGNGLSVGGIGSGVGGGFPRLKRMMSICPSDRLPKWIENIGLGAEHRRVVESMISTDKDTALLELSSDEIDNKFPFEVATKIKGAVDNELSRRGLPQVHQVSLPRWIAQLGLKNDCNKSLQQFLKEDGKEIGSGVVALLELSSRELESHPNLSAFSQEALLTLKAGIDTERAHRGCLPIHCTEEELCRLPFWLQQSQKLNTSLKRRLCETDISGEGAVDDPFEFQAKDNHWLTMSAATLKAHLTESETALVMEVIQAEAKRRDDLPRDKGEKTEIVYRPVVEPELNYSDLELLPVWLRESPTANALKAKLVESVREFQAAGDAPDDSYWMTNSDKLGLVFRLSEAEERILLRAVNCERTRRRELSEALRNHAKELQEVKNTFSERIATLRNQVSDLEEAREETSELLRVLPLRIISDGEAETDNELGHQVELLDELRRYKQQSEESASVVEDLKLKLQRATAQNNAARIEIQRLNEEPQILNEELFTRGQALLIANERCAKAIDMQSVSEKALAASSNCTAELHRTRQELLKLKGGVKREEDNILKQSKARKENGQGISRMERRLIELRETTDTMDKENSNLRARLDSMHEMLREAYNSLNVAEIKYELERDSSAWNEVKCAMMKREEENLLEKHAAEMERLGSLVQELRAENDRQKGITTGIITTVERQKDVCLQYEDRLRAVCREVIEANSELRARKDSELQKFRKLNNRRISKLEQSERVRIERDKALCELHNLRMQIRNRSCQACHSSHHTCLSPKKREPVVREAFVDTLRIESKDNSPSQQRQLPADESGSKKPFNLRTQGQLTPYDSRSDKHLSRYHEAKKFVEQEAILLKKLLRSKSGQVENLKQHRRTKARAEMKAVDVVEVAG